MIYLWQLSPHKWHYSLFICSWFCDFISVISYCFVQQTVSHLMLWVLHWKHFCFRILKQKIAIFTLLLNVIIAFLCVCFLSSWLMGIMCVISEVIFLQLAIFYTLLLIRLPVRLLQQYQPSEISMKPLLHLNLAYLCRVPHYIKSSRKFWWKSSLLRTKVHDQ